MNNLSIIIPYYKGKDFIFNCIDSLFESYELSQKKMLFEIIVVVDSPEEYRKNNIDLISYYDKTDSIKVIFNECNIGVAASRNKGSEASHYDFLTFIDQDDQVASDYFSIIEVEIDSKHACFILNGYWHYTSENKYLQLYFIKPDLSFESLVRQRFCLWTPGLMITNKTKIEKNFIDVSVYKGCDDWAANLQMALDNEPINFKYIDSPVFIINRHENNFSNDLYSMYKCDIEVLKYFEAKVTEKKIKTLIRTIIEIKYFLIERSSKKISFCQMAKKYRHVYMDYLYNKWFYRSFPKYKLKKILSLYLGKFK